MLGDIREAVPKSGTESRSSQNYYTRPFSRPDPTPIQYPGRGVQSTGDVGAWAVPSVPRLLTRLPSCALDPSAGLVALELRLLRAQVLRFGLLAPRHGAKMRLPEGPQEWPPAQRAFPDFGGTPPQRADSRMSPPCRPSAR